MIIWMALILLIITDIVLFILNRWSYSQLENIDDNQRNAYYKIIQRIENVPVISIYLYLAILVICLCSCFATVLFSNYKYSSYKECKEIKICSMNNTTDNYYKLDNDNNKYSYMELCSDDSKQFSKLDAQNTKIINNSKDNKIVFYKSTGILKDPLLGICYDKDTEY